MRRSLLLAALLSVSLAAGAAPARSGVVCGRAPLSLAPTFSRDGSLVAYVYGGGGGCSGFGELLVASSSGGAPRSLAPGLLAASPTFGPFANRIAFTASRAGGTTVDVVGVDGSGERTLAAGADPSWSPLGDTIAYDRGTGAGTHVFTMRADGTPYADLGPGGSPQFLPNGLVLVRVTDGPAEGLYTVSPDGGGRRLLAPGAIAGPIAVSPDGQYVAYRDGGIVVTALDGGDWRTYAAPATSGPIGWTNGRIMLAGGTVLEPETGKVERPFPQEDVEAVSRDWRHLAVTVASGPFGYEGSDLYVAPATGAEPRFVGPPRCTPPDEFCVEGTDGADELQGGVGSSALFGRGGNDLLRGFVGADHVEGSFGDDTIAGGLGNDHLFGQAGRDRIDGGPGNDLVDGGPGDDTLASGTGGGRILGGPGNDRIDARAGSGVVVRCGDGRDVVLANRTTRVAKDCELVRRTR